MRKRLGAVCMTIGAVLLLSALALLMYNHTQAIRAERSCIEAVSRLKDVVTDSENQTTDSQTQPDTKTEKGQMEEVKIDGYDYIGYLSIPSQGLELPVMSDWDYSKLRIAPCRYSGTISEKNLVLIAHNYSSHFGNLDQLQAQDEVMFTDVTGVVTTYQVACIDVVPPTSAKEVVAGDFDLALVTCTYGGKTRLVVYGDEVIAKRNDV